MKIERINENQIRCTLTSADLSSRNLDLRELAYGSENARNLFREMIQTAASELDFDAEDIPLMVEAIPLPNESIILLITKIEDPEELDTRFSRFSPDADGEHPISWSDIPPEVLEGADTLFSQLKKDLFGGAPAPDDGAAIMPDGSRTVPASEAVTRIFRFSTLDQVIDAAEAAGDICGCPNRLYKNPKNGQYYLVLESAGTDMQAFNRISNTLTEFSEKTHQEAVTEAYFQEHYEIIIGERALQKLKNV